MSDTVVDQEQDKQVTISTVAVLGKEYLGLWRAQKAITDRVEKLKKRLKPMVKSVAIAEGEHLNHLVDGLSGAKGFQIRKIKSFVVNSELLEAALRERDLWKGVSEGGVLRFQPVIDEDELDRARVEKRITLKEIEACYEEKVQEQFWVLD